MNRLKSTLIIASTALLALLVLPLVKVRVFSVLSRLLAVVLIVPPMVTMPYASTVPAGPVALTGNETILVNTNLSQGRSPQNALGTPAGLNANPITFQTVTIPTMNAATPISASNLDGGIVYTSTGTIISANITLPANAAQNQQYQISSNQTISTLTVNAASGDSIATNTTPTALTASTTGPNGYTFVCDKAIGSTCTWHRLR